ncbi:hydrolase glyoxylase [Caldimicrobium thiodismutans]|jgi:glyoxylase-like metal-dependent hydrolase (beta-lactamase superfamily II)|uniref:Hydrolase glyoxylase n=1 Tax=Caldimicrobium thiodismutans TaxID=1653476 RepID=A0A0U4N350_9BACT|nr:MBL fold metallo-hydrolase [Caldimicrobium thiodismutans]BAU23734.1 hydrolase glyoxylase [Caldimicrobium thiodismutans]
MQLSGPGFIKLLDDLYQIKPGKNSSHCYLILAEKTVLIDTGTNKDYPLLKEALESIGLPPHEVDIVINTHEHFDHIGGNIYFQNNGRTLILSHRMAAVKIIYGDDEVTMCRVNDQPVIGYKVNLWLNHMDVLDLGSWFLKILHTPGHTSGSICLYEPRKKVLFSGDTLFARGTPANIYNSGSLAEYFNSLRRLKTLKIDILLPGHGKISTAAEEDIKSAIENTLFRFPEAGKLWETIMF